jgi:hypothetical protein
MATRTSELLIGVGLFGLGILALATGAFALDDDSAGRTRNPKAEMMGGIVVAKENDDMSLDSRPGHLATESGAGSNPGPTGPTASLQPINPAAHASAPEVGSATIEIRASREKGNEVKEPSAEKEDRDHKPDKGRGEKNDEDKGERKDQHASDQGE